MPDYQNSKIYKLTCDDPELIYYGATTQKLCQRLREHRAKYNHNKNCCKSRLLFEAGNVKIELVQKCRCNDKEELIVFERKWIRENKCVNKVQPGRTDKEYYQDNKNKIKEYRENWFENNKEYYKEHYKKNKEAISEKRKEKIICECGCEIRKSFLARHRKTKKHNDLMNEKKLNIVCVYV